MYAPQLGGRTAAVGLQGDTTGGCLRDDGDALDPCLELRALVHVDLLHVHLAFVTAVRAVVALCVHGLAARVAHEAALPAGHLGHLIRSAELVDERVERVVGHPQLPQLLEHRKLEPLQLFDLDRGVVLVGGFVRLVVAIVECFVFVVRGRRSLAGLARWRRRLWSRCLWSRLAPRLVVVVRLV